MFCGPLAEARSRIKPWRGKRRWKRFSSSHGGVTGFASRTRLPTSATPLGPHAGGFWPPCRRRSGAIGAGHGGLFWADAAAECDLPLVGRISPQAAEANRQVVEAAAPIIRTLGPMLLLMFVLLAVAGSWGEAAIYFNPAEVDFLFARSFTRRELLLYSSAKAFAARSYLARARIDRHAVFAAPGRIVGRRRVDLAVFERATLALTLLSQTIPAQASTRWRRIARGRHWHDRCRCPVADAAPL